MAGLVGTGSVRGAKVLRLIALALLAFTCVFKLVLTYRGLDQPAAMDQAQIARSVAQGQGFVTKFLRPIEVVSRANMAKEDNPISFDSFRDTNHAPLNITAMAIALKLTGMDDFKSCRLL